MKTNNKDTGGMGFIGVLTMIFVVLKLTDNITWSWWWVLSPLWIYTLVIMLFATILIIITLINK